MSFDLSDKRLAWIPVDFAGFKSDGDALGVPVIHTIECQVDLVDRDAFKALFIRPDEADEPEAAAAFDKQTELEKFKGLVSNWRKVTNKGQSVPFTDEHIAVMLKVPNFSDGFNRSYLAAWQGREVTREKNSEGSPENGAAAGQ